MGTNNDRNRMIDVVKGISILMVVIDHFDLVIPKENAFFKAVDNSFFTTYIVAQAVPFFVLLSGYVLALSFEQNRMLTLDRAYSGKNIIRRFLRLYTPWVPVYLSALIVLWGSRGQNAKFEELHMFFRGIEPGGYYIVVALQLYLVFPIVFKVVKKYSVKGCMIFFTTQLLYEIAKNAYFMSERSYKYHVFGYIFLLSLGVYFALFGSQVKNYAAVLMLLVGILGTEARIANAPVICDIFNYTDKRTLFGNLFVGGVFFYLYKWKERIHFMPLEILGKASYSIMIVQSFVFGILHLKCHMFHGTDSILLKLAEIVIISIFVGIVYYYIVEEQCTRDITALAAKRSGPRLAGDCIADKKHAGRIIVRYGIVICCTCLMGQGIHLMKDRGILLDLDGGSEGYASEYISAGHIVKEVFRAEERMQVKNLQVRTVTWNTDFPEEALLFVKVMQGDEIVAEAEMPMNQVPDNDLLYIKLDGSLVLEPENEYTIQVSTNCPEGTEIAVMMTDRFSRDTNYCMIDSRKLSGRDMCMRMEGKYSKDGGK